MATKRRTLLTSAALAVVFASAVSACGGDSEKASNADSADASANVVMDLVAFKPDQIEVSAGSTVTWTNRDAGAHTVTSGTVEQGASSVTQQPDDLFDSESVAKGAAFKHTFTEPGSYPYFCSFHPATMRGEVRVT